MLAIVSGVDGALGGITAQRFGFQTLFLVAAALSFLALIPLMGAKELLESPATPSPRD